MAWARALRGRDAHSGNVFSREGVGCVGDEQTCLCSQQLAEGDAGGAEAHFAHGTVAGHNTLKGEGEQSAAMMEKARAAQSGTGQRTFRDWVAGAAMVKVQTEREKERVQRRLIKVGTRPCSAEGMGRLGGRRSEGRSWQTRPCKRERGQVVSVVRRGLGLGGCGWRGERGREERTVGTGQQLAGSF